MHRLIAVTCWMHSIKAPALALGDLRQLELSCYGKCVDALPYVLRSLGRGMERRDPSFGVGKRRQNGMAPPQKIPA